LSHPDGDLPPDLHLERSRAPRQPVHPDCIAPAICGASLPLSVDEVYVKGRDNLLPRPKTLYATRDSDGFGLWSTGTYQYDGSRERLEMGLGEPMVYSASK
jgi:hypothetical protein